MLDGIRNELDLMYHAPNSTKLSEFNHLDPGVHNFENLQKLYEYQHSKAVQLDLETMRTILESRGVDMKKCVAGTFYLNT